MLCRILLWSHLVQGFCVFGIFLITASISSSVIGLFRVFASCSFSFGRLYFSRNFSISPSFSYFLAYSSPQWFLTILCISMLSVVISPLSFLVVLIWILSLFFLMCLPKGLLHLFIFSKNQLLVSWILRIVLLVSMSFKSALILVISFLLLALGCLVVVPRVLVGVVLGCLFEMFLSF